MLLRNSIFARLASNRYISHCVRNSICCLRQRWSLCDLPRFPQSRFAVRQNISNPRRGYIEPPQAAYRATRQRRISTSNLRVNTQHLRCVDMLLRNSIFARLASNRYISHCVRNSICCLRQRWSLCDLPRFPQSRFAVRQNISNPRRGYIEPPQAAYRAARQRRISTSNLRVKDTTDSTCPVPGNMSTGVTSPIWYPFCENQAQSRASVSGLQET